jgi:hypothetical protein
MNKFQKTAIRNTCLAVGIPTALIINIVLCIMYELWAAITIWILVSFCLLMIFSLIFITCLEWYYKFKLKGCVTKYEELQYINKYFELFVFNEEIHNPEPLAIDFISKAREVKPPRMLTWFYNL